MHQIRRFCLPLTPNPANFAKNKYILRVKTRRAVTARNEPFLSLTVPYTVATSPRLSLDTVFWLHVRSLE